MSTPMPTIIARSGGAVDEVRHLADGLPQPDEDRPGDDAVPDVELLDLRKGEDRDDVAHVEPVPREDLEADVAPVRRGDADLFQLLRESGDVPENPGRRPGAESLA